MSMEDPGAGERISFRHLLAGEIEAFLRTNGLSSDAVGPALCELIILLSRYREEGVALFPEVFVCDDLGPALGLLGGYDPVRIGREVLGAEGVRRALKRAAPLGGAGWSIFLHRLGHEFEYGVFRLDPFVLRPSAMDQLRAAPGGLAGLLGVSQLEDNIVELRVAAGCVRYVYLSGARVDAVPGPRLVGQLVGHLGHDLEPAVARSVRDFWRRVITDELRVSHGMLVAIADRSQACQEMFHDAAYLSPPLDVARYVRDYLARHDEGSRAAVHAAATFARGMLRADGITLLREDGVAIAYSAFVAHLLVGTGGREGGARRRTFEALSAAVGSGVRAAFYRSQDGAAAVAPSL